MIVLYVSQDEGVFSAWSLLCVSFPHPAICS